MDITDKQFDFCLLIPCYNNFKGLILSLKSVVYHPNGFMVVVVDDGSAVPVTLEAIKSEIEINYPLIIIRNEKNKGITDALNNGLSWIKENGKTKYIARLDCGDLCDSNRFYKQVDYLDNHPDTGLLGSWCMFEDKKSSFRYQYTTPTDHEQIKKAMYFRNVFIHPTVIFKTSLLNKAGFYPNEFMHAEDFALFWKLIKITHSHILNEFLVTCEINKEGISLKNRRDQLSSRSRVVARYGTNSLFKISGMLRIKALSIVPKQLLLRLRKLINRQ
jgi:glycosyltransferase involved in cell wall biosynthesis